MTISITQAIAAERQRQIQELGYTAEHDDRYAITDLLDFAARYVIQGEQIKALALLDAAKASYHRKHPTPPPSQDAGARQSRRDPASPLRLRRHRRAVSR